MLTEIAKTLIFIFGYIGLVVVIAIGAVIVIKFLWEFLIEIISYLCVRRSLLEFALDKAFKRSIKNHDTEPLKRAIRFLEKNINEIESLENPTNKN